MTLLRTLSTDVADALRQNDVTLKDARVPFSGPVRLTCRDVIRTGR
jgi:hypothetical protein